MSVKILSIDDLSNGDISRLFFRARSLQSNFNTLEKKSVVMTAFFEPSTRTKLSFAMAAIKLGLHSLNFDPESSSLKKNESFKDTIYTLISLGCDLLILRTSDTLDRDFIQSLSCSVINGGDGINEHPSQALLDCFTLLDYWHLDNLYGKKILVVGDITHSRVARSTIKLLQRLNAKVFLLGPLFFMPKVGDEKIISYEKFSELPDNFDAVLTLRIQKERLSEAMIISDDEYFNTYGLNKAVLSRLGPHCVVLHPGPMNPGVEIDAALAMSERSLINVQVKNGVYVRAALLEHCLEGG